MNRAELAALLASADTESRRLALLRGHDALADAALARALKDICLDAWSRDPARAVGAAEALRALASINTSGEVAALRSWAAGIAALVGGQMEQAVAHLDEADSRFHALCLPHTAAEQQRTKPQSGKQVGTKQALSLSNEDRVYRLLGLHWCQADKAAIAQAAANLLSQQRSDGGGYWLRGWHMTLYSHVSPPNSRACNFNKNATATMPASSAHPGGVNLALCDGSVRFVTNNVSVITWRAVGTRAGNEIGTDFE